MYLFAYTSNMNVDEFQKQVPSAKRINIARLPGYVFTFTLTGDDLSTKANMIASTDADAVVWGVLVEYAETDRDKLSNLDDDLTLIPITVFDVDGNTYKAEALMAKPHAVNNFLLPYDWYLAKTVKTMRDAGLPDIYVNAISRLDSKVDTNEERRAKNMDNL